MSGTTTHSFGPFAGLATSIKDYFGNRPQIDVKDQMRKSFMRGSSPLPETVAPTVPQVNAFAGGSGWGAPTGGFLNFRTSEQKIPGAISKPVVSAAKASGNAGKAIAESVAGSGAFEIPGLSSNYGDAGRYSSTYAGLNPSQVAGMSNSAGGGFWDNWFGEGTFMGGAMDFMGKAKPLFDIGTGIFTAYQGMRQQDLAEEMYDDSKAFANRSVTDQAKQYNTALSDQALARWYGGGGASNPDNPYANPDEYVAQHKLSEEKVA